jgi:predicted CoA-binding protein
MSTVAIIGASADRHKFGNMAVRAFVQKGWTVYPVNPREAQIEGLPAFKNIRDVPVRPKLISVYLPPSVLEKSLPDIAARGCEELWLNPGTESAAVLAEAARLGLKTVPTCSLIALGLLPSEL